MTHKGFDIEDDLKKHGLKLNIPPFLKDKVGFQEDDVIKTQTIAQHRIHAERAICKVRRNKIFHSVIPCSHNIRKHQSNMDSCLLNVKFSESYTLLMFLPVTVCLEVKWQF